MSIRANDRVLKSLNPGKFPFLSGYMICKLFGVDHRKVFVKRNVNLNSMPFEFHLTVHIVIFIHNLQKFEI